MIRLGLKSTSLWSRHACLRTCSRSLFTQPQKTSGSPNPESPSVSPATANAILKRVPKFMHRYLNLFSNAPISHVTSFLILHELTAIVPLIGIWYGLHHYADSSSFIFAADLPSFAMEKAGALVDKCLELAGMSNIGVQDKTRLVLEGAYSYAIVKSLFPIRVLFSLWGMPYFAKWFVVPLTKLGSKSRTKGPKPETEQIKKVESKKISKPRL